MRSTLEPMAGKPITIRLLDVGADKKLPSLDLSSEVNPFLGRRGVRVLLAYPELLHTQLRALARLSREHDIQILVPMVTLAQDMKRLRELLVAATAEVGVERLPPLGAMIETPAAALCVVEIMTHADFLSIGTNDLTQYTMAAGREDPLVSDYFRDDHPAVLRLVRRRRCWRHTVGTVRRTRGTCERAPAPGCGGYPQPECGTTTRANRQGGGKTDAHSSQIR
jgi:phosphoenolpyruvate-protein phosphotransferase (PTS system enzyme I)